MLTLFQRGNLRNDYPHEISPVVIDDVGLISVLTNDVRDWLERYPDLIVISCFICASKYEIMNGEMQQATVHLA